MRLALIALLSMAIAGCNDFDPFGCGAEVPTISNTPVCEPEAEPALVTLSANAPGRRVWLPAAGVPEELEIRCGTVISERLTTTMGFYRTFTIPLEAPLGQCVFDGGEIEVVEEGVETVSGAFEKIGQAETQYSTCALGCTSEAGPFFAGAKLRGRFRAAGAPIALRRDAGVSLVLTDAVVELVESPLLQGDINGAERARWEVLDVNTLALMDIVETEAGELEPRRVPTGGVPPCHEFPQCSVGNLGP